MRIKSKKKLALLVSMALTVGSTLAVNPMDAYAATSVTWDATENQYKVTVGDSTELKSTAKEAVTAVIAGLANNSAEDNKNLTINFTDTAWSSNFEKAKDLVEALQTQVIAITFLIIYIKDIKFKFFTYA